MRVLVDYKCPECEHEQTNLVDNSGDMSKAVCEKCGKESLRYYKQAIAFQLNGTGWFKTGGY